MNDAETMQVLGAIDYRDQSVLVVRQTIDLVRRQPAAEAHFLHVSSAAPEPISDEPMKSRRVMSPLMPSRSVSRPCFESVIARPLVSALFEALETVFGQLPNKVKIQNSSDDNISTDG